ncbi:hypothetical protein N2152v2_000967 [Parachlorella kessleri]
MARQLKPNMALPPDHVKVVLKLSSDRARAVDALVALQGKGLTSLVWDPLASRPLRITDVLPRPLAALFPSLRQLELRNLTVPPTWLRELSGLPALECLKLTFWKLSSAATAGAAVRFPSLPSLAHLVMSVWPGPPELRMQLDDLPALTELVLGGGRAALLASRPVPQL